MSATNIQRLDKTVFANKKVGGFEFKPLRHKGGKPVSDLEYICMLGEKAVKAENEAKKRGMLYPDYGHFDRDVLQYCGKIYELKTSGEYSDVELRQLVANTLNYEK